MTNFSTIVKNAPHVSSRNQPDRNIAEPAIAAFHASIITVYG